MIREKHKRDIFHSTEGFSTLGMVVALLVTLSLLFSAAQVYRIRSASADIQNVADAAVLAAQNEVSEFMIVARVCDAVVLSLTLTGLTSYGLGVVALCVPGGAGVGEKLIELGKKVMDARDSFAKRASKGLNTLQKALPFLVAVNAASVASANNGGVTNANYLALAVLVPFTGKEISITDSSEAQDLDEEVRSETEELKEAARAAEDAVQEAQDAKKRAYMADCGDNPSRCMYERASTLAQLNGSKNPLYKSVDTWSFSVPLKRAQDYYAARLATEAPKDSSVEEQARSRLRKIYYEFASTELSHGYVLESGDTFQAYFPVLPKNTNEMRHTTLYTDVCYPAGENEKGELVAHAWRGCPKASAASSLVSIQQMEEGSYETCDACGFDAASLGQVASATTSINTGFEYHYRIVAQAASDYAQAREELDPQTTETKEKAQSLFEQCKETIASMCGHRIDVEPPGTYGAIALVVNLSTAPANVGFESSFVKEGGVLGVRAAVSGATMIEDESDEGKTLINSLLDGFGADGGVAVGASRVVLDCWSGMLGVYGGGQQAIEDTIAGVINTIPLASASGLGTWAADAFESCLSSLGLEAAELNALKPVLINTAYVASEDDGTFATSFLVVKRAALASTDATSLFSTLLGDTLGPIFEQLAAGNDTIEIASIDFPIGDISIPITITLPPAVSQATSDFVAQIESALQSLYASFTKVRVWE